MKFIRFGAPGAERPGLIDGQGQLRDLSGQIDDLAGETLAPENLAQLAALDPSGLPAVAGTPRLGPCVTGTVNFIAIGLNYSDHAEEAGLDVPPEPVIFFKAASSICGPNDDVERPRGAEQLDWEVELGVVIGKRAKYVEEASALDHVAGYCVVNDVSERHFQLFRHGQWTKGKSHDTFGPVGPWLVTKDEVPDPQALAMWLDVNGERMQNGTTANMVFGAAFLVAYLSNYMTLHPGDIISTGTPSGIGNGMTPQRFLKPGDVMTVGLDKLGEQVQTVVDA
jgi:2-keto-4-pentenoate hydratase/2-oxohepta-3-ene-1,7-dioic acid hydratase in catechol pathway